MGWDRDRNRRPVEVGRGPNQWILRFRE